MGITYTVIPIKQLIINDASPSLYNLRAFSSRTAKSAARAVIAI
jgi:hypothetical protein